MPIQPEVLLLGRQIPDSRLYQAFKEINDRLEELSKVIDISPDNRLGLGFLAHPSAILDLNSTEVNDPRRKLGLGLPNLTLSDKRNIAGPLTGLLLYESSRNALSFFNGARWVTLGLSYTATGQVGSSGVAETELFSINLPASFLDYDGMSFDWFFQGTVANNGNAKTFKVYLGATLIFQSGANVWTSSIHIKGTVTRIGPTSQYVSGFLVSPTAPTVVVSGIITPTEIMANPLTLKITGQGTNNNDCVGYVLRAAQV
jgi:hypothetical protein